MALDDDADMENALDETFCVVDSENALRFRWPRLGRDVVEGYGASLAQILHPHGLFMINGIDHIDWGDVPFKNFGLEFIDVQILNMIKCCDDNVAIDLIAKAHARQSLPKPDKAQKVVNCHVPFDFHKWISPQLEPNVADLNNKIGMLVIGSSEKSSMKPSTEAPRLVFEKKSGKIWLLLKSKPLIPHNVRQALLMSNR